MMAAHRRSRRLAARLVVPAARVAVVLEIVRSGKTVRGGEIVPIEANHRFPGTSIS
jgi:hypothetical protein